MTWVPGLLLFEVWEGGLCTFEALYLYFSKVDFVLAASAKILLDLGLAVLAGSARVLSGFAPLVLWIPVYGSLFLLLSAPTSSLSCWGFLVIECFFGYTGGWWPLLLLTGSYCFTLYVLIIWW